jgi:hypothetical protein
MLKKINKLQKENKAKQKAKKKIFLIFYLIKNIIFIEYLENIHFFLYIEKKTKTNFQMKLKIKY